MKIEFVPETREENIEETNRKLTRMYEWKDRVTNNCRRRTRKRNRTNQTPITELNLDVRSYNILIKNGLRTVEQLEDLTDNDLLELKHFGTRSLKIVREEIKRIRS